MKPRIWLNGYSKAASKTCNLQDTTHKKTSSKLSWFLHIQNTKTKTKYRLNYMPCGAFLLKMVSGAIGPDTRRAPLYLAFQYELSIESKRTFEPVRGE